MDKLLALLPIVVCIGMHFLMMKGMNHGGHVNENNTNSDGNMYTCPMHKEIKSDKPGKCPKCGMELVKAK